MPIYFEYHIANQWSSTIPEKAVYFAGARQRDSSKQQSDNRPLRRGVSNHQRLIELFDPNVSEFYPHRLSCV